RERPAIFADLEGEFALAGGHEGVALVIPLQKRFPANFVGDGIAGRYNLLAALAKDCSQLRRIPVARSLDESGKGFRGGRKGLLARALRMRGVGEAGIRNSGGEKEIVCNSA